MKPQLEGYALRLRVLGAKARELGATPVFVTQPSRRYKASGDAVLGVAKPFKHGDIMINGVDYYLMLKLLNEKTLEAGRREGGIPIDLASEVPFEDRDFYDFNHMTPSGAAKVGHYLYENLTKYFQTATPSEGPLAEQKAR